MVAVRWTARVLGLLLVALVLAIIIGEGFDPTKLQGVRLFTSAAFLSALIGMVLLWRWETIGGAIVIAGMLAFYAIHFAASGRLPGGWVFPLCFLPGILALLSQQRLQFSLRTLLVIMTASAVILGAVRCLGGEVLPFALAAVGVWFSTRIQSRHFFVWLPPLVWSFCAFGSYHNPGDEYGLFIVSILPSVWLAFLLEFTHLSEIYPLLIAAGALPIAAVGFVLDRLAVSRRLWAAVYISASAGLLSWGLLEFPSLKAAIAKNGSISAYAFCAANLGLCLSLLLFVGGGTIIWLWRRVHETRRCPIAVTSAHDE